MVNKDFIYLFIEFPEKMGKWSDLKTLKESVMTMKKGMSEVIVCASRIRENKKAEQFHIFFFTKNI